MRRREFFAMFLPLARQEPPSFMRNIRFLQQGDTVRVGDRIAVRRMPAGDSFSDPLGSGFGETMEIYGGLHDKSMDNVAQ